LVNGAAKSNPNRNTAALVSRRRVGTTGNLLLQSFMQLFKTTTSS
jgi:hypothetical protein